MTDWRLTGQEEYMTGVCLKKIMPKDYQHSNKNWHEHCEFCMEKIDNSTTFDCYITEDKYRWVCSQCFNDFKDKFKWKLINKSE